MKRIFVDQSHTAHLAAFAATYTVDRIPNVHLADGTRFVSDPDNILSPEALAQADADMRDIRRSTSAEAVVVVVDDIEGGDIDSFATELFTKWGLGKSDVDNGLLILVAKDLRRAAIRPGYGLEGVLPDVVCAGILRNQMFLHSAKVITARVLWMPPETIRAFFSDPDAAAEILSREQDADFASRRGEIDLGSFFRHVFRYSCSYCIDNAWFCCC